MKESLKLDYITQRLFSIPVHYLQIDNFGATRDNLIEYSYDLREKDHEGRKASNNGGYQSQPFNINDSDDILHRLLINAVSNIPCFRENIDIKCDAWVNINPPKSFNSKHCHPACDIAGVLWIKIPKNSGDFVFISPYDFLSFVEMHSYTEEFKKKTNYYHNYIYPPQEGAMLLFPAHLQHRVKENKSNEDRISVSFNLKILNVEY